MRSAFFVLLASTSLLLPGALADHCTTWSTSEPEVTIFDPLSGEAMWYIDNDLCQLDGCLFSVWVYPEANGIPGLQRGDEVVDDTCHGMIEPDTLLF